MQPSIETGRLSLTPVSAPDLSDMLAILHDPQVQHFLLDDEVLTVETAEHFIRHSLITAAHGLGLWMVRRDQSPIGVTGLKPLDDEGKTSFPGLADMPEVIIGMLPSTWGQGYAGEVIDGLLCYAFKELGHEVMAGIADEPNGASRRMLERAGFREVARGAGKVHPLIGYELKKSHWQPQLP